MEGLASRRYTQELMAKLGKKHNMAAEIRRLTPITHAAIYERL